MLTRYNKTTVRYEDLDCVIKEAYLSGESTAKVARDIGLSVTAVRNSLARSGVKLRARIEALRAAKRQERGRWRKDTKGLEVTQMYAEGHSIPEIARATGLSWSGVRHRLLLEGYPFRGRGEAISIARRGIPNLKLRGERSPNWRGGRIIDSRGYVRINKPGHPRATNGYVFEHILVWEEANGQELPKGWVIHHLNGIVSDNRIENLVALPSRRHYLVLREKAQKIRNLEKVVEELRRKLAECQTLST